MTESGAESLKMAELTLMTFALVSPAHQGQL
jgi:hypothetical protein